MARKLIVEIVGESGSLERALGRSSKETSRFGSAMGKLSGVAKVAGVAIAGGIAVGLEKSVHAAIEAQASQARLAQSFKNAGLSADAYEGQIKKAEEASAKLGFTEEDVHLSIGSLVTATGSAAKAMKELHTAQDIARFKGVALTDATKMLTMAQTGSQRAAKQLGINVSAVTSHVDALKASHVNTATAAGKLELAHAKLLDKMATGNAVIDAVKQKVEGQADAFSKTAAGGMAAFHAQLNALEIRVGTGLLPTLTKAMEALSRFVGFLSTSPAVASAASTAMMVFGDVMQVVAAVGEALLGFYNRHKTAALAVIGALAALSLAFAGPTVVIVALGVALIELWKRSQTFRDIVNAAFQAVHDKVMAVMPTIRSIITQTVTVVEALWRRFGSTIVSVLSTAVTAAGRIIKDLAAVVGAEIALIGDLIHGRWGKIWGDLKTIVSHAFDALVTLLRAEVAVIFTIAASIGKALIDGIVSGVSGLASTLKDKVVGQIHGALDGVKGAFGIHSPSDVTAREVGQPLGEGVVRGWVLGSAALPSKMAQTLQDAITKARTVISDARSTFATTFGSLVSVADSALDALQAKVQTKSEKALAKLTAAHDAAQSAAQLAAAKDTLAQAQASGDTGQILAAQQAVDDLLYQAHVAALQKQADTERLNLNARLAIQKQNFDAHLAALQASLAKHGATTGEATRAILKLLRGYGVNFAEVGRDMGIAWIKGLKDAIADAAKGAGKLSGTVASAAASIKVPSAAGARASGGPVSAGLAYLVGERGPELFVPRVAGTVVANGGGGTVFNFSFPNYVGDKRELMDVVKQELHRDELRGGTAALGF